MRALLAVTDAGPIDRRVFLLLTGASITSPAHEWLLAHPAGQTTRAVGASIPAAVVDHLDHITAHLRRLDDQLGGGQLAHLIHEHLRYVTGLLRERSYDDTVGRRLDAALTHAGHAIDVLSAQVDSARCRGHLFRLTQSLAPHRRSPRVRDFLDSTRPLLTSPA